MTWRETFNGKNGPVLWGLHVTVFSAEKGYVSGILQGSLGANGQDDGCFVGDEYFQLSDVPGKSGFHWLQYT